MSSMSKILARRPQPADGFSSLAEFDILPPVFLLPNRLSAAELHSLEKQLIGSGMSLTHDLNEARLVLGKVNMAKRAEFELRSRNVLTRPFVSSAKRNEIHERPNNPDDMPRAKKRRTLDSEQDPEAEEIIVTSESETESERDLQNDPVESEQNAQSSPLDPSSYQMDETQCGPLLDPDLQLTDVITVVRLDWLTQSLKAGKALPVASFVLYKGVIISAKASPIKPKQPPDPVNRLPLDLDGSPNRAQVGETEQLQQVVTNSDTHGELRSGTSACSEKYLHSGTQGYKKKPASSTRLHHAAKPPSLIRQTTSDFEASQRDVSNIPSWIREGKIFACQRRTPSHCPNDAFIDQLKKIRLTRKLTADEIGVRAYSTSIAALAAYDLPLKTASEVLAIPGCDAKIAQLFHEWNSSGRLEEVENAENDEELKVLRLFYEIWGVGATKAREFYHQKGWRDLDDIVEYGWNTLSRVQQIGVKYYEEFQTKIPREEVKQIADVVTSHARQVRDDGIESCIVGGYRRGKAESGDVDIIISHRETEKTLDLILDIVQSLENEGWITHTLLLATTGSQRGQQPLPHRNSNTRGAGFDTLDKGLVVWQDINNPDAPEKNKNIHRRVDIIIAPWPFVGCSVAGWSGGTTFQRDLRRYAKRKHNWKFDSSGIRDRSTGQIIRLGENAESMVDAERMVFEGFGLPYLDPSDRCTG